MFVVDKLTLIPQKLKNSCWYASAQMLINWRQEVSQSSSGDLIDPSLDADCRKIRDDNNGLLNPQILAMAKRLGLESVPPMSPTPAAIEGWLRAYGPLWVNGKKHIVVIGGINGNASTGGEVKIYNPSPIDVGRKEWLPFFSWYTGNSNSSRDTASDVEAVFLHCPQR